MGHRAPREHLHAVPRVAEVAAGEEQTENGESDEREGGAGATGRETPEVADFRGWQRLRRDWQGRRRAGERMLDRVLGSCKRAAASLHKAQSAKCRVVIATRASLVSAVTGAYAALSGPLHGGAPGPVLDMLDEIGGEQMIGGWLDEALDRGDRLMGFGHRIYRTRDPRADVLKAALIRLAPETARLKLAMAVEDAARTALNARHPERPLDTNVEFYTALLLDALGIPRTLFTPVFAIGRVAGWTAHAIEHHARRGRLIRPEAVYVGARP